MTGTMHFFMLNQYITDNKFMYFVKNCDLKSKKKTEKLTELVLSTN